MFTHVYRRTIEWGECDPAGIVFYPRFLEMFDAATGCLFEAASGLPRAALIRHYDILGWPMVSSQVDFRATASFDDRVDIHSVVRRLGRTSLEINHELRRGDLLCVAGTEVRVWARHGVEGQQVIPTPLPDLLRRQLSGLEENEA
ncbi:MAG: thioesterase family protein [Sphingobium sp.]|nr:thioesterase family protein [Sphingobium sp.]